MIVEPTELAEVLEVRPRIHADERGWFLETWRMDRYREWGIGPQFVQANASKSTRHVLRGLHYQWPEPQGKLVWVSQGRVLDLAVDLRRDSSTFGHCAARVLDDRDHHQLWVPEGFGHGFVVLSKQAVFNYLCTRAYRGDCDRVIAWDDPDLKLPWPVKQPELSPKDASAPRLSELGEDDLPSCASS